jgi:putative lipoprotein (rSAM/lipoprotein system)
MKQLKSKGNWVRKIIGGLSFTSAMFIFQACYGTPQDFEYDLLIEGKVKAQATGLPIKSIRVSVADDVQNILTDEAGSFSFYTFMKDSITLRFEDIDSAQNGLFASKDTVLTDFSKEVFVEIALAGK